MRIITALSIVFIHSLCSSAPLQPSISLDKFKHEPPKLSNSANPMDWLIDSAAFSADVYRGANGREIILSNGLIRRVWRIEPNLACVSFDNLMTGQPLLRAVRPEALLSLNGHAFDIGGLTGQPNHAFLLNQWLDDMKPSENTFQLTHIERLPITERFSWKRIRHHAPNVEWPPAGVSLRFDFQLSPAALKALETDSFRNVTVSVFYELYDGIPLMSKWIRVNNDNSNTVTVDRFTSEILAIVEHGNSVEFREGIDLPKPQSMHVETDMAFGGFNYPNANRYSVHWLPDPEYHTQVNYMKQQPCLLKVEPTLGPDYDIAPGKTFTSFRTFELVYDSTERERQGLALRRMYRTIAPWVTENPIMMHLRNSKPEAVEQAIDQCAETGFEMLILSFGSGFQIENESPEYIDRWKRTAEYARSKGIEIGGYSLLSSRRIKPDSDNIHHPETGKPGGQTHGYCPALTSEWGQTYFGKLYRFFKKTGFTLLEHDGSYPGDADALARPPLQKSMENSRWAQWTVIRDFYQWCRSTGVYLNVPDYYYLVGSSKCGMGYRETNWSLPREHQVIHTRQNIFDGTWEKTPSMGWMFVPLSQYHGGGAAATVEPLDEHLDHYERMMASNFGAGVQACYRGPRLYDTERTQTAVRKWVQWYKTYRDILESDIIHTSSRRADGRDIDWIFHANPALSNKGMLVIYNPLDRDVERMISLDLYYTGLTDTANVQEQGSNSKRFRLSRKYTIRLTVRVQAGGMNWYLVE